MMEKKKDMICQTNALTNARYNFTAMEKNVLYFIIKKIRENYIEGSMPGENFEWQNFYVTLNSSDFSKIADENHTTRARQALRDLRHKDIEITDEKGNWLNVGFINYAEYNAIKKYYEVEVSKKIMPHLVELTKRFTAYSLTVVISLKSKYSQRFYELSCQYRAKRTFFLEHDELLKMLKMENSYKRKIDFRRNVIDIAICELKDAYENNRSDLWLEFSPEGRGKDSIYNFIIHAREDEKEQETNLDLRNLQILIYNRCKEIFKKDKKFCERIMQDMNLRPEKIQKLHLKLSKMQQDYKGRDLAKLLRWILREDFGIE